MADRLLLEYPTKILLEDGTSALLLEDGTLLLNEASATLATDAYQLQDASGVILLEPVGVAYVLTVDFGSFTETGQNAILKVGMPVASGSFTLTGKNVIFLAGIAESFGSYTLTGKNAILGVSVTTAAGAFTETGKNAIPKVVLPAAFGSFALAGENASLTYVPAGGINYTLSVNFGAFTETGKNAILGVSQNVASGPFSLSGKVASLNLVAFVPVVPVVPPPIVLPIVPPVVVIPPSAVKIEPVIPRARKPRPIPTGVPSLSKQIPWWDRRRTEKAGAPGIFLLSGGTASLGIVRAQIPETPAEPAVEIIIPTQDYELLCSGGSFVSAFGKSSKTARRKRISNGGKYRLWYMRAQLTFIEAPPPQDNTETFDTEEDDEEEAIILMAERLMR